MLRECLLLKLTVGGAHVAGNRLGRHPHIEGLECEIQMSSGTLQVLRAGV